MRGKAQVELPLELTSRGWLEATLVCGGTEAVVGASYLTDAPSDLIHTVRSLLEGRSEAVCAWQEEPGEYRWIFRRDGGRVFIAVLWFEKNFSRRKETDGEPVFAEEDDLVRFAKTVLAAFHALSQHWTPSEYEKQWGYPFPQRALKRLQEAIGRA